MNEMLTEDKDGWKLKYNQPGRKGWQSQAGCPIPLGNLEN